MNTAGVGAQVLIHEVFAEAKLVVFARRRTSGSFAEYQLAISRDTDEDHAFEIFQVAADRAVVEGYLEVGAETLTWLGKLDIIPKDFIKLGG